MVAALLASAAAAQAAIFVSDAKIEAGKLLVSGTASSGAQIRLDGQEGAAFNAKAGVDGSFSFGLVYHPGDCVVTLEALLPPYLTTGESADALVANCGPAGVTAKGEWRQSVTYVRNDLVTHGGSTWRARRNNAGRIPAAGADWEVFAAAGEDGAARASNEAANGGALRAPPSGPAGGDLQGNYPNPQIRNLTVAASNLASNAVTNPKIATGAVTGNKVADETITAADLATNSVDASEIASNAVTGAEIASNAVRASEIADNSIDSGEIVDFGLSNQDIGVLFAQVNADGSLANSSGGVTSSRTGGGIYAVDFGRNISTCAFVISPGDAGTGVSSSAITGASDLADNPNGVFVLTRNDSGAFSDSSFQLVVVC